MGGLINNGQGMGGVQQTPSPGQDVNQGMPMMPSSPMPMANNQIPPHLEELARYIQMMKQAQDDATMRYQRMMQGTQNQRSGR